MEMTCSQALVCELHVVNNKNEEHLRPDDKHFAQG